MIVWRSGGERRGEYRIPVECPVVLMTEGAEKAREGVVENLSRFGAQVRVRDGLSVSVGTAVSVDFGLHGDRHQATGTVRWCLPEKDAARLGLLLDGPLSLAFPLEDVASICSRLSQEFTSVHTASSETTALLARAFTEHHLHIYWGSLLWILADAAHSAYSCAAGNVNLSVFRLERFLAALSVRRDDETAWAGAQSALQELRLPEQKLKKTALLFRLIKDKPLSAFEPAEGVVQLDAVLSASIHELRHAAGILADNGLLPLRFDSQRVRPVAGRGTDFAQCFDTLLLFTYQSALFGKARAIDAEIQENAEGIEVVLRHDGMQILDKPRVEIQPLSASFLAELVPRDVRDGLWLHGSLLPVRDYSPTLVVHSEAGKNRIVVRFPLANGEATVQPVVHISGNP